MNAANLFERLCPVCGAPLGGCPPESLCAGVRCTACDYGVVTTNPSPRLPAFDRTEYDVWVEYPPGRRAQAIGAVATLLGIGARAARTLVDAGEPVKRRAQALEVQGVARLICHTGFRLRVVPDFPWPLHAAELAPAPDTGLENG